MAHFHNADAENNGPAFISLDVSDYIGMTDGMFYGSATLTSDQVSWFMNEEVYVNVHSTDNAGGELRGQVAVKAKGGKSGKNGKDDEDGKDGKDGKSGKRRLRH